MGKVFLAKIESEYEVDENNYLHWEWQYEIEDKDKDEDFKPRSKDDLIRVIANELAEIIYQGIKSFNIEEMIVVEEKTDLFVDEVDELMLELSQEKKERETNEQAN